MLSVNVVVSKIECVVLCIDRSFTLVSEGASFASGAGNRENWNSTLHCGFYLVGFDDRLVQLSWPFILCYGGFAPFGYDKELFLPFRRDGCDAWKSCRVHFSS